MNRRSFFGQLGFGAISALLLSARWFGIRRPSPIKSAAAELFALAGPGEIVTIDDVSGFILVVDRDANIGFGITPLEVADGIYKDEFARRLPELRAYKNQHAIEPANAEV